MIPLDDPTVLPLRLAAAGAIGLAVGLEREWSGPADRAHARFAGLRTFFLIGLAGGIAGTCFVWGLEGAGVAILSIAGLLIVAAYVAAVRGDGVSLDGTTEMAAAVVLGLGLLAALGQVGIAAGVGAVVVLMLGEKARLHWLVERIAPEELEGALQFAVLAFVVLPLLPTGPYGGVLNIRPRTLWAIVLLFSALNYCGYVARRVLGANRGYGITGLLGGLVSSTAVTFHFSRRSRVQPDVARALAVGTIGACTVLLPRVVILSAFVDGHVALALIPRLLIPALVGTAVFLLLVRRREPESAPSVAETRNPLALAASIRMAIAFQVAVSVLAVVQAKWGALGIYAGSAVLGLTDVDALTVSATQSGALPAIAAQAIGIGIVANTLLKGTLGLVLGAPAYRRVAVSGLLAMLVASVLGLVVWWT